jgi:DNA polymerase type B, organellar and viral
MKKLQYNVWHDWSYDIDSFIFSEVLFNDIFYKFGKNFSSLPRKDKLLVQLKWKIEGDIYRSISYIQSVSLSDFDELRDIFLSFIEIKSDEYKSFPLKAIIFSYKLLDSKIEIKKKIIKPQIISQTNQEEENKMMEGKSLIKNIYHEGGYNLPNTMDLTEWGECQFSHDYGRVMIHKKNSKIVYDVNIYDNYNYIEMKVKDKIIIRFKDILEDSQHLNYFKRIINNKHEYYFENGEIVLKKILKKVDFLRPIPKSIFLSRNFLTMDIETRKIRNIMSPYCISIFDGDNYTTFYLSDYKNSDEMMIASIAYINRRKYNHYKIYLHNFSHFDSIFLLKYLSQCTKKIKPIIRDGRIIDIKCVFDKGYTVYFRDSFLLLPSSLRKLAENFNVENKGYFPYKFPTEKVELNYKGKIPSYKYFDNLSIEEYNIYKKEFINKEWSLRDETILYCEKDVKILHQIIVSYSKTIFDLFRIDMIKYPTLSSLSFAIFRSNFLRTEMEIPLIKGEMYNFLKKGYTGGSVDVFKPYGKNIYRYDVNSLFPFVMKEYDMPTGQPIWFEGDILNKENNPFGFFEANITSPKENIIPLLQLRYKTKNGMKTLSPLGNWSYVYFSEELYNSKIKNYRFKPLRGYIFKKRKVFKEFVETIYDLKVKSKKGSPNYIISKLLLNSLYGRLGMRPDFEEHEVITYDKENEYINKFNISDIIDFKNGKELISFYKPILNLDKENKKCNISVVISAAVTAYSRIYMSQFKNNKDYTLFYSDTDSIDINKPLSDSFIGKEIGLMKLEHIFDEAVYLAPKVYGGKTNEYDIVKAKGVKVPIPFSKLKPLLYKNTKLQISQEKWYKNVSKGEIKCVNEMYNLMVSESKRELIYDENNKLIDTKAIVIDE